MVPAPGVTPTPASSSPRSVILTGPTATGKTAIALEVARAREDIEIVNADSLVVYRGMDIGTAKPSREELSSVPHHLVDVRDPDQPFTAGDFVREAERAIADIHSRGRRALLVGGTGFYLRALTHGLWQAPPADPALRAELESRPLSALHDELRERDPASAARIGPNDRYRLVRALEIVRLTGKSPTELQAEHPSEPDPRFALWILDRSNVELERRIAERSARMLADGLLQETRALQARFPNARPLGSVGYAQAVAYLDGRPPSGRKIPPGIEGLRSELELATRQLVKRQRTWFRGQETARWFTLDRDLEGLRDALREAYA